MSVGNGDISKGIMSRGCLITLFLPIFIIIAAVFVGGIISAFSGDDDVDDGVYSDAESQRDLYEAWAFIAIGLVILIVIIVVKIRARKDDD